MSDHSRHPGQPPGTGEHHSSCASCSKSSQQLSLPRKGQKSSQRYIRDNYLTMPTRPTTRDDYRTEQDGHTSIRRGTSYHHLQGNVLKNNRKILKNSNKNLLQHLKTF